MTLACRCGHPDTAVYVNGLCRCSPCGGQGVEDCDLTRCAQSHGAIRKGITVLDTSPRTGGCRSIACSTSAAASATTSPSTTTFLLAAPATSASAAALVFCPCLLSHCLLLCTHLQVLCSRFRLRLGLHHAWQAAFLQLRLGRCIRHACLVPCCCSWLLLSRCLGRLLFRCGCFCLLGLLLLFLLLGLLFWLRLASCRATVA